jgi:hypothetical protein
VPGSPIKKNVEMFKIKAKSNSPDKELMTISPRFTMERSGSSNEKGNQPHTDTKAPDTIQWGNLHDGKAQV